MGSAARRDYQYFQGRGDCRRTGVAPLREQAQHQLHLVPVVHADPRSGPVRRSNFLSAVPFFVVVAAKVADFDKYRLPSCLIGRTLLVKKSIIRDKRNVSLVLIDFLSCHSLPVSICRPQTSPCRAASKPYLYISAIFNHASPIWQRGRHLTMGYCLIGTEILPGRPAI